MPLKLLEPGFAPVSLFQFTWCKRSHIGHRDLGTPGHGWLPPPQHPCPGKGWVSPPAALRCAQVAVPSHQPNLMHFKAGAGARAACPGDISVRQGDMQAAPAGGGDGTRLLQESALPVKRLIPGRNPGPEPSVGPLRAIPGIWNFSSPARSASTDGDVWGFFCPPSTQLQGHLHLKWELGPLAARLLLIVGLGACPGTKPANAISGAGALHIKDPRLP